MDRYTNNIKIEEIRRLADMRQYKKAMSVLESIDANKVRMITDLSIFAEIYARNQKYEEAMEILLRIYDKSRTRRVLYQLINLSVKRKSFEEAERYYEEYKAVAPGDSNRFVLRYRIDRAEKKDVSVLIETLERLKEYDYIEEWAYELTKLYHRAGMKDKCVRECSDIILWFGEGVIVEKARLLREHYIGKPDRIYAIKASERKEKENQLGLTKTKNLEETIVEINDMLENEEDELDITFKGHETIIKEDNDSIEENEKNRNEDPWTNVEVDYTGLGILEPEIIETEEVENDTEETVEAETEKVENDTEETVEAETEEVENDTEETVEAGTEEVENDTEETVEAETEEVENDTEETVEAETEEVENDTEETVEVETEEVENDTEETVEAETEEVEKDTEETVEAETEEVENDTEEIVEAETEEVENDTEETVEAETEEVEKDTEETEEAETEEVEKDTEETVEAETEEAETEEVEKDTEETVEAETEEVENDTEEIIEAETEEVEKDTEEIVEAETEEVENDTEEIIEAETEEVEKDTEETVEAENEEVENDTEETVDEIGKTPDILDDLLSEYQQTHSMYSEESKEETEESKEETEESKEETEESKEETEESKEETEENKEEIEENKEEEKLKEMEELVDKIEENSKSKEMNKEYHYKRKTEEEDTIVGEVNISEIFKYFMTMFPTSMQITNNLQDIIKGKEVPINFLITGYKKSGKTELAKRLAKTLYELGKVPSRKIALIDAEKLNTLNLDKKRERLADGCLIVKNCEKLDKETINQIVRMIEELGNRIVVIIEGGLDEMDYVMEKNQELKDNITHRIDLPSYDGDDLLGFAYDYVESGEFVFEEAAEEKVLEIIDDIMNNTKAKDRTAVLFEKVKKAKNYAKERNVNSLRDIVKNGDYTETDLLEIKQTDFKNY